MSIVPGLICGVLAALQPGSDERGRRVYFFGSGT